MERVGYGWGDGQTCLRTKHTMKVCNGVDSMRHDVSGCRRFHHSGYRTTYKFLYSFKFARVCLMAQAVSTGSSKLDRSSEFGLLKVRSTSGLHRGCWRLSIGPSSPNRSDFAIGLWILNAIYHGRRHHRRPTRRMIQRLRQHYYHISSNASLI